VMRTLKVANQKITRAATVIANIAILVLTAVFNTGCSTEPVPYTNPDPPETAWYAYQNCVEAYGSRATVCNNVGYSNVQGTYYYTGTADTASLGYAPTYTSSGALIDGGIHYTGSSANSYHSVRKTASQSFSSTARSGGEEAAGPATEGELIDKESLRALDDETLNALAEQWRELAQKARSAADR